jgi:hypothetical protein
MFIIGRGRYAREGYPEVGQGGAAAGALRNRNVATTLSFPAFTPATSPSTSLVAALLFTPRVSGVIMATALLGLVNGAAPETYGLVVGIATGTGLSVTGGSSASNGWIVGSTVPILIGGTPTLTQVFGESAVALAASGQGSLNVAAAISQPLPVGVPVVIEVLLTEIGGGHALSGQSVFSSLSALELP